MLRVALCDDHPIFREGLKRILLQQSDIRVEAEVGSGAALLEAMQGRHFDVVILDIALPDMSGLDVLKSLQASGRRAGVLVLSMHPEEHYARRVLKAGAAGYLQKESPPEELLGAIRRIANGGKYVTPSLAERLAVELEGNRDKAPHELLSDREYQVLCLLAAGKGVKEIAQSLSVSAPTVSTYRARVLEKLGLTSTVELVRYALERGLIE
jgi:two-component system, NarL family, invasion response regulator UvrY